MYMMQYLKDDKLGKIHEKNLNLNPLTFLLTGIKKPVSIQ